MLARLRFIPEIVLGPVIRTKFLSTTSTITHFFPASRPKILTQILPTSIAGNFNPRHLDWEYTSFILYSYLKTTTLYTCNGKELAQWLWGSAPQKYVIIRSKLAKF